MPTRGLIILAGVTAIAVVATWATLQGRYEETALQQQENRLVFPGLHNQIEKIANVEMRRGSEKFSLKLIDGAWVNEGLGGFPAKQELMQSLIANIAALKFLEPKTSRSNLHNKLGVENVAAGAKSVRLIFNQDNGKALSDVIVGKSAATGAAEGPRVYIRKPNEQRAWLAAGSLIVSKQAASWSDNSVVDIPANEIAVLSVTHHDGQIVPLYRAHTEDRKLTLKDLPPDSKVEHQHQIDYMASLLKSLSFQNAARTRDTAEKTAFEAQVRTSGKLHLTFHAETPNEDGTVWTTIAATADNAANPDIAQQAATFNSKFEDWHVKLPRTFADRLKIRLADIIGPGTTNQGLKP